MTTKFSRDPVFGHNVAYDDEPDALTPEQMATLGKIVRKRFGEKFDEQFEKEHVQDLEAKRQDRLIREAFESLTPEERALFDREHNPVNVARRLAAAAVRESDELFNRRENETQFQQLEEWKKSQSGGVGSGEMYKKIVKLTAEGEKRIAERQQSRQRRELEAEAQPDELSRVWATLDGDQQQRFQRLLSEEPSALERVEQFKAQVRNPIADIEDSGTLYRMAMEKPKREKFIPPTSEIENIEDPRTLFSMHSRDTQTKKR